MHSRDVARKRLSRGREPRCLHATELLDPSRVRLPRRRQIDHWACIDRGISSGIDFAVAQFAKSKWQVERRIIDISGDGTNNSGRSVTEARDQAVSSGLTINGLAIINDSPNLGYSDHSHPPGGLQNYYRQNVIGGPNAFVLVVEDFKSFADAMANKLVKEIDVAERSAVGRISCSLPSE